MQLTIAKIVQQTGIDSKMNTEYKIVSKTLRGASEGYFRIVIYYASKNINWLCYVKALLTENTLSYVMLQLC